MKMKRLVSVLLAGVMVLSLVGCGSTEAPAAAEPAPAETTAAEAAPAETADAATGDAITLDMWCIATESDSNRGSYEKAIADMQAAYPNITFNWEAFENESYKTKIKAAVSADGKAYVLIGEERKVIFL